MENYIYIPNKEFPIVQGHAADNDVEKDKESTTDAQTPIDKKCSAPPSYDETIRLNNPHLQYIKDDHLYHIGLSTEAHDLKKMFGDVKFICMGGTPDRMKTFAFYIKDELKIQLPTGADLYDISHYSHRYAMYKVGPVISVSHGMGFSSLSILLHELFKLVHYAGCKDVVFIRIGTSGGIGIPPGSVVVSTGAVNEQIEECAIQYVLGREVKRPAKLDVALANEIYEVGHKAYPKYNIVHGKTMSSADFYEGQGRLDGAFCHYTQDEKMDYLRRLADNGVVNIEMEGVMVAAMCLHAGVPCAVVCVTLLDRLKGDQVKTPKDEMFKWQQRPQQVVAAFIKSRLGMTNGK